MTVTLGTTTASGMVTEDDVAASRKQPTGALDAFAAQDDLDTSQSYASGTIGSAKLDIMPGRTNIEASNFRLDCFKVTNTGDKKISAIFIDVSGALYPDSVFDPDGAGGDSATKPWAIDTAGNTGAYVGGGIGGYFLPGPDPLPNTTGTGKASNGGYKGAMVKFDPSVSDGFGKNETVGFSGDMDPNSIAGLTKKSLDNIAVDSWDVGGISGHELIGSTFTVLFDDGTTASGQLGSDGSASGSHAIATQNGTGAAAPTLIVNGVGAGGTGTYGGTQPSVIVSGTPGDTVMVTLTKGFNPVQGTGDIPALVENRLNAYDFKANNTFDNQHIVVKLNSSGQADISGRFDYDSSPANNKADGTFPGDDVSPIGFVAAVVDPNNGNAPISPITKPIYLTNKGGPVTEFSATPVAENAAGAVVGEVSVTDPDGGEAPEITVSDDRFEVADGMLKLKSGISLDFEAAYSIPLTLTVTDGDGLSLAQDFEIAVQDVAEGRLSAVTNVRTGSDAGETLKGTGANDLIVGLGGKDTLIGRKGDDILAGGKGADKFVGGKGFDTLDYSDSGKGVTVNLQKGVAKGGDARGDKFKSMEGVIGSDENDKLLGSKAGNVLIGGAGADVLNGRGGKDWADYSGSDAGVTVNLATRSGVGGDAEGDRLLKIENVHGSTHNDTLTGDGRSNMLAGDDGRDKLVGGGGRDTLDGGAGNDRVLGGGGADSFIFDEGNDKLVGGKGRDTVMFDGDFGDFGVTLGKKVIVTFEEDRDVLRGMERLEFDDTTYAFQKGNWVELG